MSTFTSVAARSALLGLASGGRSSLGVVGPRLSTAPRNWRAPMVAAVLAEVVVDKLPMTPPRTTPPALAARLGSGAWGAARLARGSGRSPVPPAVWGAAGALAGSYGGLAWRQWAGDRMPAWIAAVAEDAVAVAATYAACRS